MAQKNSIAAFLPRWCQSFAAGTPESKYRWAEYLLIFIAALNQLGWKRAGEDSLVHSCGIPIALLAILAAGINQTLSNGYGTLGGHYVAYEQRDNTIREASMAEAQANGGTLTAQEQQQLNNREANLQNAVNQYTGQ